MKPTFYSLCLALTSLPAFSQELTTTDRELILEQLAKIREASENSFETRTKIAYNAFQSAAESPASAFNLYMKCEEMVNFKDLNQKHLDFVEWKRKNEEKFSSEGFRMALQIQLKWLVLTMAASAEKPDHTMLAQSANATLSQIVENAKKLKAYRETLDQNVGGGIFAKAYDVKGFKQENWPESPSQLIEIYDKILLPPLRKPERIAELKAGWERRMLQESELIKAWSGNNDDKNPDNTKEYERFIREKIPEIKWQAEMDLYRAEDQRAAALRMLEHIQKNLTHEQSKKWIEDFSTLINGNEKTTPTE